MATNPESEQGCAARDDASAAQLLASRRRLLRGSVGVAPVVLSLNSGRVMGLTNPAGQCASASAFGSMNVSRPRNTVPCSGVSPGYWKQYTIKPWPAGCYPVTTGQNQATKFSGTFTPIGPGMTSDTTFLQVLNEPFAAFSTALARAVVAAILNGKSDRVPLTLLPISQIQAMWTATVNGGIYSVPNSTISWFAADVVAYITSTWD